MNMNFFMEYANNFADNFFWPLLVGTAVLSLVACGCAIERNEHDFASHKYGSFTYGLHASVQIIAISWLVFLLASSVPAPDYLYRDRVKVVEKEVFPQLDNVETFDKAYDMCMNNQAKGGYLSDVPRSAIGKCEKQAMLILNPDVKFIERTVTLRKNVKNNYQDVFDNCMLESRQSGATDGSPEVCHKAALEVVGK